MQTPRAPSTCKRWRAMHHSRAMSPQQDRGPWSSSCTWRHHAFFPSESTCMLLGRPQQLDVADHRHAAHYSYLLVALCPMFDNKSRLIFLFGWGLCYINLVNAILVLLYTRHLVRHGYGAPHTHNLLVRHAFGHPSATTQEVRTHNLDVTCY